jgi:TPR repeat protein
VTHVFLSYATPDRVQADAAVVAVEALGVRAWYAPRDVVPGAPYATAISDAVETCGLLVVLISSASNASAMVHRELELAASARRPVLPVRIEDVAPSKEMRFYLGREHWLDVQGLSLEARGTRIAAAVRARLAEDLPSRAPPEAAPAPVAARSSQALPASGDLAALRAQAEAGVPEAQRRLGLAHQSGFGVPKDPALAARWLREAAQAGDADAQAEIGRAYLEGEGVRADAEKALAWLSQAADKKHPTGMFLLAQWHMSHARSDADTAKGIELLHAAAEQGSDQAAMFIGVCYWSGLSVGQKEWFPRSPEKAHAWLLSAAERGNPDAQMCVSVAYFAGRGVARDEERAVQWVRTLAVNERASPEVRAHARRSTGSPQDEELLRLAGRPDGGRLARCCRILAWGVRTGRFGEALGEVFTWPLGGPRPQDFEFKL